jgi:hypothetical protein
MRAILAASAVLALGAVSVPASAQWSNLWYHSMGHCTAQLKKIRSANTEGASAFDVARWDAAYCVKSGDWYVFYFPF